jgi:hypothetical protein
MYKVILNLIKNKILYDFIKNKNKVNGVIEQPLLINYNVFQV